MALLAAGPAATAGIDFRNIDVNDFVFGAVDITTTLIRLGTPPTDFVELRGKFTLDASGKVTGGTINEIETFENNDRVYAVTGISVSMAMLAASWLEDDTEGFLAAVFKANDTFAGSLVDDFMGGYAGNDTVGGLDGSDTLNGDAGNDSLDGGADNDSLAGGAGGDTLDGGASEDDMDGGAGNDRYVVDSSGDKAAETGIGSTGGADTVRSSAAAYTLGANIENLTLAGTADSHGTGNALANTLVGNSGNNELSGDSGKDKLLGGEGDDILGGGGDNDTLDGGIGSDDLDGGSGDDSMAGGGGDDVYGVDSLKDRVAESLTGEKGGGEDTIRSSVSLTLGKNLENLVLLDSATPINATGNTLGNKLTGNSSANILDGKAGADTMAGGKGDDIYFGDTLADRVEEDVDGGEDEVRTMVALLGAIANVEHYTFTGKAAVTFAGDGASNKITGTAGNDTLAGDVFAFGGNDTLIGGAGADSLSGYDGSDTYVVDNVGDKVMEEFDDDSSGDDDRVISSVAFALVAGLEHLDLIGKVAISGTGTERSNEITGNAAANKLLGLGGDDSLVGGAGNDTLDGGAGADGMDGGLGNDTYVVDDPGDIVIEADKGGTDTILSSINVFLPNAPAVENVTLTGTDDLFAYGNLLKNLLVGNDGDNDLDGNIDGGDTMIGGAGNDTYNVHPGDVAKESLAGTAGGTDLILWADDAAYTLGTNIENLILVSPGTGIGNALDNVMTAMIEANKLVGMAGNDSLTGAAGGNDTLDGGTGKDTMMGLDGDDFYVIDDAEDIVTESEFEGIDEVRTSIALTEAIAEVENYTFTGSKAVSFTGSYWANKITGTAGNDSLRGDTPDGGSYGDTLNGGAGADTMAGGLSDDTYVVDNVKDVILDTGGWDRVISSISFTLREDLIAFEGLEELFLTGSAALTGMGRDAQFSGDLIIGNAGANKLFGLSGNDTLDGGAGNDTLDGGFGVDAMTGGAGNDVYIVDDALDTVSDSAGIDTVLSSVSLSFLTVSGVENIKLTGSDDIDCFVGVTVTGNDGNNELSASKMIGGGGDDVYWVGNGSVVVESQAGEKGGIDTVRWMGLGDYTLAANVENLVTGANATGNGLNNRIDGTAGGANHFDGAAGNDTIIGGAGDDTITVSLGNDRVVWGFEFDFLDGHDLIVGFDGNPLDGQDVFDLDLIFDNWAVPTNDRASSVSIVDNGATVDVYYGDTVAATLQTTDEITIGEDVSLGTL